MSVRFSKLYWKWAAMKRRCLNPKQQNFERYGGRGIKVCNEWLSFDNFKKDMEATFREGLTLDRIDPNGNYCKENCRWADDEAQRNNKRNSKYFTYNGMTKSLAQWSRFLGIKYTTLLMRINNYHWPIDKALTREVNYG